MPEVTPDPQLLHADRPPWDKVGMIVADPSTAEQKRREFRDRGIKYIIVFHPGASIAGYRFSTVLLTSETYERINASNKLVDWWNESLRCRVALGGQIVVIP